MIFLAIIILFLPMLMTLQQTANQQRQRTGEPPPIIEHLAFIRRDFVDPSVPNIVLVSMLIPTHARIIREGKTWEIGGQGEPVQTVQLTFREPFRLRNGQMAYSTDDLLAKDKRE